MDYAYSDKMLGAGHTYRVHFNDDTRNPRIIDADEIERDSAVGRYLAISCGQKDPVRSQAATPGTSETGLQSNLISAAAIASKISKVGLVRSLVATSDGNAVYKVR